MIFSMCLNVVFVVFFFDVNIKWELKMFKDLFFIVFMLKLFMVMMLNRFKLYFKLKRFSFYFIVRFKFVMAKLYWLMFFVCV